jgi:hypothetical protein
MNEHKKNFEKHWRTLFDSLFGDVEEIDDINAQEILQSAGIDYDSVRKLMYNRAAEKAASLRLSGQSVPVDLQQTLDAFRPLDAPPRNEEEARKQAQGVILGFLGPQSEAPPSLRFALSYRNRGELTDADVGLLDSIVDKLKKQVGRKER